MSISNNMPVIEQVSAAMSLRTLEHQVIVSNIANRDAQGYQRLKLQFDRALQSVAPTVSREPESANASLQQDLVALSANAAKYQAMARVLNRYFAVLSAITSQNRG